MAGARPATARRRRTGPDPLLTALIGGAFVVLVSVTLLTRQWAILASLCVLAGGGVAVIAAASSAATFSVAKVAEDWSVGATQESHDDHSRPATEPLAQPQSSARADSDA